MVHGVNLKAIDSESNDFFVNHLHLQKIETKIHKHKKGQLLFAEGGIIHVFVNEKHWYLPARCFMWIPANTEHKIITFSPNVDLYNFYFKMQNSDLSFYHTADIYYAGDLLREMILYTKDWNGAYTPEQPLQFHFIQAIKAMLPELVINRLPETIQHPFPKDKTLLQIARFLTNNLERNYTLEEVAKEFGLSPRTLSRKFKENMGMSYVRFLRSLRITKALELIAQQHYNMYEVAMLVGYGSLSAFSTIFYKIIGIRPTEYAQLVSRKKK